MPSYVKRTARSCHYSPEGMAKLILTTLAEKNGLAVLVADTSGKPKRGLGEENFRVASTLEGADGSLLRIERVSPSSLPGLYFLDVATKLAEARLGTYVFDLVVEDGADRGRTMASVRIA